MPQAIRKDPVFIFWIIALLLVVWYSIPLFSAWSHDPSLQFGEYIFGLWLLSGLALWRWPRGSWPWHQSSYVILAALCLFFGIVGELQALIYMALALLLSLPIRHLLLRGLFTLTGTLWMPVWAWAAGPFFGGKIAIVSLVLALILPLVSVSARIFSR
ncbi:MAG: hypothetical protein ACPGSB_07125 [Opitutales bacterium]